jgi:hypothetical protein
LEAQDSLPAKRVKDIKTSIRYLARALGKETPEQCQQNDFLLLPTVWKEKLNRYFLDQQQHGKTISPHTLRNTRQNLSFLFRTAQQCTVLTPPQPLPPVSLSSQTAAQVLAHTSPYAQHWHAGHTQAPYRLASEQWPPDIQSTWLNYCDSKRLKVRQTSLRFSESCLSSYIGFLINIEGSSPQWDDLFDITTLDRFVRWHSQRVVVRLSVQANMTVKTIGTLASHFDHPALPAIRKYRSELPIPEPLHNKQRGLPTLADLEAVALAILQDAYKPRTSLGTTTKHLGLRGALGHQHALMLRLLVRVPLRSRNLREIQLEKNLYKDDAGHWHLSFSGEELKIGTRKGRTNTYHVDLTAYCPDLLPHFEEFLALYRLRIPNAAISPFLFLTKTGQPYASQEICAMLTLLVFKRIKKRFYPHLIRTIWATEYITQTGDFTTAAHMLGDTVQMVLQRYHEIIEREHKDKARNFLTAALRQGK